MNRPGFRQIKMYVFMFWVRERDKGKREGDGTLFVNAFYINVSIHLYDKSRRGKTTRTENRSEVTWDREVRAGIDCK